MSEVRNSFEKWALDRRLDISHNSNGGYDDETTQVAWESWVASRGAASSDDAKEEAVTEIKFTEIQFNSVEEVLSSIMLPGFSKTT